VILPERRGTPVTLAQMRRTSQRSVAAVPLVLTTALGCNRPEAPSPDAAVSSPNEDASMQNGPTPGSKSSRDATSPPVEPSTLCETSLALRDCFSTLELVAGLGRIPDKGVNGWLPEYEGAPATEVELSRPHMAQSDESGNIYVADKDAHAVRKIDTDGKIVTIAGMNTPGDDGDEPGPATERRLNQPNGIHVLGDGTVFVLDLGNAKVRKVSPSGEMTTLIALEELSIGRGLWVADSADRAYISSQPSLLEWTSEAGVTVLASGFSNLSNLFPSQQSVLVTDRTQGTLERIDASGERQVVAGGGTSDDEGIVATEARLPGLRAVWPDAHGGYYLGLHEGSRVDYLDANGHVYRLLNSDEVAEVRSVSLDETGALLVVDDDAGFVKRLRRD